MMNLRDSRKALAMESKVYTIELTKEQWVALKKCHENASRNIYRHALDLTREESNALYEMYAAALHDTKPEDAEGVSRARLLRQIEVLEFSRQQWVEDYERLRQNKTQEVEDGRAAIDSLARDKVNLQKELNQVKKDAECELDVALDDLSHASKTIASLRHGQDVMRDNIVRLQRYNDVLQAGMDTLRSSGCAPKERRLFSRRAFGVDRRKWADWKCRKWSGVKV